MLTREKRVLEWELGSECPHRAGEKRRANPELVPGRNADTHTLTAVQLHTLGGVQRRRKPALAQTCTLVPYQKYQALKLNYGDPSVVAPPSIHAKQTKILFAF